MGITLLRRQQNNYYGGDDGNYMGYSNVCGDAITVFSLADIEIDRRSNQMGFRWRDLVAVPTMVHWRILPRSKENQKRATSVEISPSTSVMTPISDLY